MTWNTISLLKSSYSGEVIHIISRPGGLHLDSREMWPFYKKVSELNVPIDVHISDDPGLDFLDAPYALRYVMAREYDICAETLRICVVAVATMRCALTTIKPEKLMFATDWTWNFEGNPRGAKKYVSEIRKLELSGTEIEGILGDNAAKLMGL